MKTCPSCSSDQPDWALQCPGCGATLAAHGPDPSPPAPSADAGPGPAYPPPGYGAPDSGAPGYSAPGYRSPAGWWSAPEPGGRLAGWWHRVGATVIDVVILVVFESLVGAVLGGGRLTAVHGVALAEIIDLVGALAYQGLLLSYRGQTVGMMAVGTRIIDARSGGGIGVGRGVLRAVIEGIFAALLFVPWLVDIAWPLWDRRNQTLHDKIVGTLILRTR